MGATRNSSTPSNPGDQGWKNTSSLERMKALFRNRTDEERIQTAKAAGILDQDGKVTDMYKSWGNKPSRTPESEDD